MSGLQLGFEGERIGDRVRPVTMTPEEAQALKEHAEAIAAILYKEAGPEQLTTLAGIEATVREQLLEHVSPNIGAFLSAQQ